MNTPRSEEFIGREWPAFTRNVKSRLIIGAQAYGGRSHDLPPEKLLTEIQQELEDVAGWASILWAQLERLKRDMGKA